jgi:hypothetical protein
LHSFSEISNCSPFVSITTNNVHAILNAIIIGSFVIF